MQKNLLLLQDLYCKNLIKQWACIHLFTPVSELLQDEAICVEMNQAVKVAQLPEVTDTSSSEGKDHSSLFLIV